MRTEFELLCQNSEDMRFYLGVCIFRDGGYHNDTGDYDLEYYADRLNGAWWMYQELHNSLGFFKGGYVWSTKYDIDSILGRGCFEHFKTTMVADGTSIGSVVELNVSQPYMIDKINLECNDIINLTSIKKED